MFVQSGQFAANVPKEYDEKIKDGNYFIIDWVGNDPLHRGARYPIVVAGNITEEQLQMIADKKIIVENPRFGTAQRVIVKVEKILDI